MLRIHYLVHFTYVVLFSFVLALVVISIECYYFSLRFQTVSNPSSKRFAHMTHSRNPSAASCVSFASFISEPISEMNEGKIGRCMASCGIFLPCAPYYSSMRLLLISRPLKCRLLFFVVEPIITNVFAAAVKENYWKY